MKQLLLAGIITLLLGNFASGQNSPMYASVCFHKIVKGHTMDDAMSIEKEWQQIQQIRKDAGLITGWAIFQNYSGMASEGIDFDYISVDYGTDLDKIHSYPDDMWNDFVKKNPSAAGLLTRTWGVQQITRRTILANVQVLGGPLVDQYYVFNNMKVADENSDAYEQFEKQVAKVHEERIKSGSISRWSFWRTVEPYSWDNNAAYITVQAYPKLQSLVTDNYVEPIKRIMNMDAPTFIKKANSLRKITASWVATLGPRL